MTIEEEGISGIINLPDDDLSCVERMLCYMYAHDYSDIQQALEDQDLCVVIYVSMYTIADKYSVLPFKELAITKVQAGLEDSQNHSTLTRDVAAAIKTLYTTLPNSDRGLRDPLGVFFKKSKKALYNDAGFMEMVKSGFAEGDLTLDVIDAWTDLEGKDSVDEQEGLCSVCTLRTIFRPRKLSFVSNAIRSCIVGGICCHNCPNRACGRHDSNLRVPRK